MCAFTRPLPACPAGEAVRRLALGRLLPVRPLPACPAGEAVRWLTQGPHPWQATELLHQPDKPAGVELEGGDPKLAAELLHLPDKPAGVRIHSINRKTRFRRKAVLQDLLPCRGNNRRSDGAGRGGHSLHKHSWCWAQEQPAGQLPPYFSLARSSRYCCHAVLCRNSASSFESLNGSSPTGDTSVRAEKMTQALR